MYRTMLFNDKSYQVDFKRLSRWSIPLQKRRPKFLALLFAMVSSVNDLHTRFLFFRQYIKYRLNITPQYVYLEKLLNDRFDVQLRRIQIIKAIAMEGKPLFLKAENKPKKLGKKPSLYAEDWFWTLFTKAETLQFTVDFIVKVPIDVPFDMNELTSYLDQDVMLSKTYKVQIV